MYEAKLELDEEIFASMPEVSEAQTMAIANKPEIVTRTENPLQDAIKVTEKNEKVDKAKAAGIKGGKAVK